MPHRVLFVDDEPRVTDALKRALRKEPYQVLSASSARQAMLVLRRYHVDVVISDECMPGMRGTEFLAQVCQEYPDTIRMILTGHATLEMAIEAINEGKIYRFFTKPCNEVDMAVSIRQALQQKELLAETKRLAGIVKQQAELLEGLERQYPGITRVKKDSTGLTIIEDPGVDAQTLIKEIESGDRPRRNDS